MTAWYSAMNAGLSMTSTHEIEPGLKEGSFYDPTHHVYLTPGWPGWTTDEAIATDQDRRVVWVVGTDETVSARTVRPGPRIDGYRLIHEGLNGDETIVVAGLQRLRAGTKVASQPKELPPTRP